MRALYIDAFSGISGNMFMGALLDLGVPHEHLIKELDKLNISGYYLDIKNVLKAGISATYVDVVLEEYDHHHHEHEHEGHHHGNDHNEGHHHHHDGEHEHGHAHTPHHNHSHHHEHRGLTEITKIINSSQLPTEIKEKAVQVFTALGKAEAKVHNKPIEEIHFHEVGAIDTIVDVVGSIICLDWLKVEKIFISKIRTGFGFVKCVHGDMPVPAPATAELLRNMSFYHGDVEKELATPTGVALASTLAEVSVNMPKGFIYGKVGYGAGGYELNIPNALRMFLGEVDQIAQDSQMIVVETNIDDMNPQLYGHVMNKLFATGASDVWITPILMKKGRPACLLSALVKEFLLDDVAKIVFEETSSLGVRYYPVERNVLQRYTEKIKLPYGEVHIKYGKLDGKIVNIAPEFEDCSNLSALTGRPIKIVWQEAMQKALQDLTEN